MTSVDKSSGGYANATWHGAQASFPQQDLMSIENITHSELKADITRRMAVWWDEADTAIDARQIPRARRYLRWILAAHPHDEEAWLLLAQLASEPQEEMAYLRQAYAFHPASYRTVVALREARARQLRTAVQDLAPRNLASRCLPTRQNLGHPKTRAHNGNGDEGSRVLKAPISAGIRSLLNLL